MENTCRHFGSSSASPLALQFLSLLSVVAVMAAPQMLDFLRSVDASAPGFVEAVSTVLVTGGFDTSDTLNQAVAAEVLDMFPVDGQGKLTAPKKAFVRRAIASASAAQLQLQQRWQSCQWLRSCRCWPT